ncbi:MAG: YezD family protein [Verrucomicrobiota bacterium]
MSTSTTDSKQNENSASHNEWMDVVLSKIQNLRFGSVQITVHEGRVTLVESIEKTRFNSDSASPAKSR